MSINIKFSQKCLDLVTDLYKEHGPLLFHLGGGCCDGTNPVCFTQNEFKVGSNDIKVGSIADFPFYIHKSQLDHHKNNELIIDVREGVGAGFSLEVSCDKRFVLEMKMLKF